MNLSDVDLGPLKAFYAVAKEGGFTKASKVLHVQQPALSRAVKLLEEDLGVVLLDRHKRSTTLTTVGVSVFAACARIFAEATNIRTIAEAERSGCRGPLHFGAVSAIAASLVPQVHARYLRAQPEVWPRTLTAPSFTLVQKIAANELEFALLFYHPRLPTGLRSEVLAEIPFALVIASKHAKDLRVRASFIGSREVEDQSTRSFPALDRLRRDVPEAQIRISSNDAVAHEQMVLAGLGVSILPEFLVRAELAAGTLTSLYPNEAFLFPLLLVSRKDHIPSRAARLYLDELRASL